MSVDAAEALRTIRDLARKGLVRYRRHATLRMDERGIRANAVSAALRNAARCEAYDADGWRVFGRDTNGDEVAIGVYIEDQVVVATVMWP